MLMIPYTLQFKQPAGTSRGIYYTRKLWYILLQSTDGSHRWGVGECAPLPGLSCDARPDYGYILASFCRQVETTGRVDWEALRAYPSMLFGFETAFLQYESGSFCLYDTPFSRGEAGIPINGLIWMGEYDEMLRQIEAKMAAGFRCIKLKIGAIRFEEELELLKHIRHNFSVDDIELRVDANGAFAPDEALEKLNRLAELQIHSIEQPVRAGQWMDMARLVEQSPIPVALDEELIGINSLHEKRALLDVIRPDYLVLKPSLHGGIKGCTEWIAQAAERGIRWWVTSALESNVGLNAIAQWCATLDNPMPQGLGTGQLFTENIPLPLSIRNDSLWFEPSRISAEVNREVFGIGQSICIDGRVYTRENLSELEGKGGIYQDILEFLLRWYDDSPTMTVQTSGSTGVAKEFTVRKQQMVQSACLTCSYFELKQGDTALLCLPIRYIAGKMMLVRALVAGLNLVVCQPSGHPFGRVDGDFDFAALTPMQVYNSLRVAAEKARMKRVRNLIIGGGSVDASLEKELYSFPGAVYSTYGMTETLSHIALRRLSGVESWKNYAPFPSVKVSVSEEGTLIVDAPLVSDAILRTNDMAEIFPDGRFAIYGRKDNVINSGGIKLQIEELEAEFAPFIPCPFAVTSMPDAKFGEIAVLLVEADIDTVPLSLLKNFDYMKHIYKVERIPRTVTGKIDRKACRELALAQT